jgi:hypothetical protein
MNIFKRKINQKQIEQFELKIAELLEDELPQLKKAIGLSKVYGINFMYTPKGISLSRDYDPKAFEEINRNHKTSFYLTGILVLNRETKNYQNVKLFYYNDTLNQFEIENPEYFHKVFDLNQIKKSEIKLEYLKIENPDKKIAEDVLKSLSIEQINMLDLDYTFEIDLEDKTYYTILDMEDGNHIAVDKRGRIYRLNHDHEERVKLIANKPTDFFKIYSGQKSELEN